MSSQSSQSSCSRCQGTGYLPHFSHVANGVCFMCGGDGLVHQKRSVSKVEVLPCFNDGQCVVVVADYSSKRWVHKVGPLMQAAADRLAAKVRAQRDIDTSHWVAA